MFKVIKHLKCNTEIFLFIDLQVVLHRTIYMLITILTPVLEI